MYLDVVEQAYLHAKNTIYLPEHTWRHNSFALLSQQQHYGYIYTVYIGPDTYKYSDLLHLIHISRPEVTHDQRYEYIKHVDMPIYVYLNDV
jgi:hypothetical protein